MQRISKNPECILYHKRNIISCPTNPKKNKQNKTKQKKKTNKQQTNTPTNNSRKKKKPRTTQL